MSSIVVRRASPFAIALSVALISTNTMAAADRGVSNAAPVSVSICDSVSVNSFVLRTAKRTARTLFGSAGIAVEWTACDGVMFRAFAREPTHRRISVVLMSEHPPNIVAAPQVLGAVVKNSDGDESVWAIVPRTQRIADRDSIDAGVMLGHVIAHEIGHLLLPRGRHSPSGLMAAQWTRHDSELAAQGRLRFSEDDARQLRAKLGVPSTPAAILARRGEP